MANTEHLSLRGRTWWYVRKIPVKLRTIVREPYTGKALFRCNLRTSDLALAQIQRARLNPMFEAEMLLARKRAAGNIDAELKATADAFRAEFADQRLGYDEAVQAAETLRQEQGPASARRWYLRATDQVAGTEIDEHLDRWLASGKWSARTNMERRKVVNDLARWRSAIYAETITRDLARAFVDEVLAPGHSTATINKHLSMLTSYWQWLMAEGFIPETVVHWSKFRRKKERVRKEDQERAFTNDEMVTLLSGNASRADLRDAMIVGALTGARLEEIGKLKVADVDLGKMTIHLPGEKTEAAERTTPLHTLLKAVVAARMKGKAKTAWLFHELPERAADSAMGRSSVISKAFTRYRVNEGVDARVEGKRRALTNFHSFRRWFSTQLVERGVEPDVRDAIMGWKRPGMAGLYTFNADFMKKMRKAVSAVRLPKKRTN